MPKDWEFRSRRAIRGKTLKEFEKNTREELIDEILELRLIVVELEKKINKFDQDHSKIDKKVILTEKNYKQSWSLATKIEFLIKISQKPLTSEDLHKQLMRLDTHYPDYDVPKSNLSVCLGRVTKSQRIIKIKRPGIKLLYFVLPDWVDEKGKLLKDYSLHLDEFI